MCRLWISMLPRNTCAKQRKAGELNGFTRAKLGKHAWTWFLWSDRFVIQSFTGPGNVAILLFDSKPMARIWLTSTPHRLPCICSFRLWRSLRKSMFLDLGLSRKSRHQTTPPVWSFEIRSGIWVAVSLLGCTQNTIEATSNLLSTCRETAKTRECFGEPFLKVLEVVFYNAIWFVIDFG